MVLFGSVCKRESAGLGVSANVSFPI